MEILTCWITNKDRAEALKEEFEKYYSYEGAVNPLTITQEDDEGFRIEIDPRGVDLLHFFHAGIQHGINEMKKRS